MISQRNEVLQVFQKDFLTLEDGNDRLSRNVCDFQYTVRNLPEERRSGHTHGYIVEYVHQRNVLYH